MSNRGEELAQEWGGKIIDPSYDAGFVALSYVVSFIGAAATLELINRRTSPRGKFNHLLLASSSVTMGGIAIWCMHFIGNRSIELANGEPDLQIAYSGGFTALSFFVPILVLLTAFVAIGTNDTVSWWRVTIGGVLAGSAICGMHYLGNASIENYTCVYEPVNVVGAAIIAVTASIVALAVFFVFRAAWASTWWKRLCSAIILAGAVSGMHWCAATGTRYRFVRLYQGSNELSRNTTVIVVICLSVGACFIMGATAMYTARIMRRYAHKAQQIVLAAAIFDKHGRILVNPDGLLPSEKITDSFLEKTDSEPFSTAHPLFHWMFRVSRNWAAVSSLIPKMTNHVAHLPKSGRDRNGKLDVQLIDQHGETIDNYDVVFRELFCMAAQTLADKTKEHVTAVGVLWDEILPTGASGERRVQQEKRKRNKAVDRAIQKELGPRSSQSTDNMDDMAEKGSMRQKQMYGRGSLMFMVRQIETERDIERVTAAGYRFAELNQVSNIIANSMQIKTPNVEGKLREMALAAGNEFSMPDGVQVGFFGMRARVGTLGFDVLVRREARNLLPSVSLPLKRLESWHMDFLRRLEKMTVGSLASRLGTMSHLPPKEAGFAAQLNNALAELRRLVDNPILDDAVLVAKPFNLPNRVDSQGTETKVGSPNTLIALRLVIPIHIQVNSTKCEFIPLNFFKVQQLVGRSSPYHLAFTRSVHLEIGPIINSVPTEKGTMINGLTGNGFNSPSSDGGLTGHIRRLARRSVTIDGDGNPIPTDLERGSSPHASVHSGSTTKLWNGGNSDPSSPTSNTMHDIPFDGPDVAPPHPSLSNAFGGIMVSQEIQVNVEEAEVSQMPDGKGTRFKPKIGVTAPVISKNRQGPAAGIEMKPMADSRGTTNIHTGAGTQVSNVEVNSSGEGRTFVDDLFSTCIDNM